MPHRVFGLSDLDGVVGALDEGDLEILELRPGALSQPHRRAPRCEHLRMICTRGAVRSCSCMEAWREVARRVGSITLHGPTKKSVPAESGDKIEI
jgi:hypothetical protein